MTKKKKKYTHKVVNHDKKEYVMKDSTVTLQTDF